jgi:peptide/nickel transport system substrate-binding protein
VVRNAAAYVWDTLYGVDEKLQPQRQMVEGEEVSSDGLTWTFKLRPGLKFHDGTPVLAKDVVASLVRWSARDPMGLMLRDIQNELTAVDDRTWKWVLKKPYPKMLLALAKNNAPCSFIMPERIRGHRPVQADHRVYRLRPDAVRARRVGPGREGRVREVPRLRAAPGAGLLARRRQADPRGPDRVGHHAGPGNGRRRASERRGGLVGEPALRPRSAAQEEPEHQRRYRRPARQYRLVPHEHAAPALRQREGAPRGPDRHEPGRLHAAIVGDDDALWKPLPGYFTPGTPLYNEEGGEVLKMRNLEAAKKLLAESGYKGEPVVCVVAQDQSITKAQGEVTADLLKKIGFNVDFVATDWGTTGTRRAQKNPPGQGGWNMFHTWHAGADCINPAAYTAIRANGDKAWFGWPNSPEVEKDIVEWFDAKNLDEEKAAMRKLNKDALDFVVYAPTGFFLSYQAWRKNVTGVVKGPLPFAWGVSKTA